MMKSSFLKIIILLSLILLIGSTHSVSAIHLEKVGNNGYTTVIDVSDFVIKEMDNGYVYLKVAGGYLPDGEVGKPALPEKMFRLAIGKNKKIPEIKTSILEEEKINLSQKLHSMKLELSKVKLRNCKSRASKSLKNRNLLPSI